MAKKEKKVLKNLLEDVSYELLQGDINKEITDVAYDSRKVTEGFLFVAIAGTVSDGHKYIEDVINKGAAALVVEKSIDDIEKEFEGKGYGDFKTAVGEAVVEKLRPLQEKMAELEKNKDYIDSVIKNNAEKAQYVSNKTLRKVQKKVGFPEKVR